MFLNFQTYENSKILGKEDKSKSSNVLCLVLQSSLKLSLGLYACLNGGFRQQRSAHVLAHFVKSFRAYNVKSSSTLFLGNMLSNFEISFPNARFLIQLGYNLITISWDYQEWDFSDPSIIKSKKHSFKCVVLLWKTLIRVSIEF